MEGCFGVYCVLVFRVSGFLGHHPVGDVQTSHGTHACTSALQELAFQMLYKQARKVAAQGDWAAL